jgi:esterase/lipase superfamily enzyme
MLLPDYFGMAGWHRMAVTGWLCLLFGGLAMVIPSVGAAQSVELLRACQSFEEARAANDLPGALLLGRRALELAESGADDNRSELLDLLRDFGAVLAATGNDTEALQVYQRALSLQETQLGSDHPDLVPLLTTVADLDMKGQQYAEAGRLLERILSIERAAYGERHQNVLATLARLRNTYQAAGNADEVARIDATLERLTTTARALQSFAVPDKDRHYKQDQGFATVRVFYGTNRAATGELKPAQYYGSARGDLEVGYLDVSVPEVHKEGELETQPRWSIFTYFVDKAELKRRYVLLNSVRPLKRDNFLAALRNQIKGSPSKDVFVFVHGFNSSFEDAARRTAQLAYDLDFDGTPMMYSWPSQGSATSYTVDEAAVNVSGRKMTAFLEDIVAQSGAERIHLIAHSMGNRALIEALQTYLAKRDPNQRKRIFGQIVFTAPDVDRDYFLDTIESLRESATRVTLYASDRDLALKTSQAIHGAPRAGMAGSNIITWPGLDTIDMSGVEGDLLGHSYFAADAGAIYDLFRLLWRGDPPPRRCGMSDRPNSGKSANVWLFNVSVCKGNDLLEAGVLVKRFGDLARARVTARIAALTDPSQKQEWSRILTRLDGLLNTRDD